MQELAEISFVEEDNAKPKTLSEDAYLGIKRLIYNKKFAPGQRLIYQDLGKTLNMSQTPIINALNRLDQEGFVAYENFRGFFVKPIDSEEVWNASGFREAVEVYAVKQAIQFADGKGIEVLGAKLVEHETYVTANNPREKFLLNSRFHIQIAEMTRNPILKFVLKRNLEHVYLRADLDHYDSEVMRSFVEDHHQLLDRMKKKDIIGAIDVIEKHIHKARDNVIKCLSTESEVSI